MRRAGSRLRRPSASMLVAMAALFVALGGAGYAAVSLPRNSVGRNQIRNNAVNFQKIAPKSVGIKRINPATVQARVLSTCNSGNSAITAINQKGQPTCKATRPAEFDTSNATPQPLTSGTSTNAIASETLSSGTSYLVTANPYITVTGTAGVAQHVTVFCELAANGVTSVRAQTFDLTAANESEAGTIPLEVAAPASSTNAPAAVACTQTVTSAASGAANPTVDVVTSIYALQTSVSTTEPNTTVPYAIAPGRIAAK